MRIIDLLRIAFPYGTSLQRYTDPEAQDDDILEVPPFHPADVFGITALLLERSGGYQSLMAGDNSFAEKTPYAWFVPDEDLKKAHTAGAEWRRFAHTKPDTDPGDDAHDLDVSRGLVPEDVKDWWAELWAARETEVFQYVDVDRVCPDWWRPVLLMFVAADEAGEAMGLYSKEDNAPAGVEVSSFDKVAKAVEERDQQQQATYEGNSQTSTHLRPTVNSLALALSKDVGLVHPKTRTSGVGCTLRTLSHSLALMPPQGQIGSYWIRSLSSHYGKPQSHDYNVLMIPFPFALESGEFREVPPGDVKHANRRGETWNWFEIEQKWLPTHPDRKKDLVKFLLAIIRKAQQQRTVHAVILPELSLNWDIFKALADSIRAKPGFEAVEILVSGSSDTCRSETGKGNFVLSAVFFDGQAKPNASNTRERTYTVTSRSKHHRWKIEENQCHTYGIQSDLTTSDSKVYWEHIPLPRRELHHFIFREGSIFTSLICEDLARSDPCHRNLRAVGPNLLFVLLMDGPQLSWRWSAQYSTGMADDPGTTILTLTSRALVRASNEVMSRKPPEVGSKPFKPDWSVALFKDDQGPPTSIACPEDAQGVFISLKVENVTESSFDGRSKEHALAWRRRAEWGPYTVRLAEPDEKGRISKEERRLLDLFKGADPILFKGDEEE